MADLLIRNVPTRLRTRLKQQAQRHHRSMNHEVLALLEGLLLAKRKPLPKPAKLSRPLDPDLLERLINAGRE